MDRDSLLKILFLMSLFLPMACDNSSSSSSGGGPVAGAPILLSANPAINDSTAALGLNITVTFDKAMNAGSATSFVAYGAQSGKLSGAYSGGGSPILAFDPANGFKPGEEIEVILTGALTATDGRSFWPFVYRFRAESRPAAGTFISNQTLPSLTGALALAGGDWDGDSNIDLAVAIPGANKVVILNNDGAGTGTFTIGQTIAGQAGARALVGGDWDADGDLDLAVANSNSSTMNTLINDGSGGFTVGFTFSGLFGPYGLAAGDWNGDGYLDLAVANFDGDWLSILQNDGSGIFAAIKLIWDQTGPINLVSGDWDNDGNLDLAAANWIGDWVDILKNFGGGDFEVTQEISDRLATTGLAAGDWNGNGDMDLAFSNAYNHTADIVTNNGAGIFTVTQTFQDQNTSNAVISGDWDGDRDLDLAVANPGAGNVVFLENDGTGSFAVAIAKTITGQSGPYGLAAGDWNGDNLLDLAVANGGASGVVVLLNQP